MLEESAKDKVLVIQLLQKLDEQHCENSKLEAKLVRFQDASCEAKLKEKDAAAGE